MGELPPEAEMRAGERGRHRLLEQIAHVEVPPTLLRDILMRRVDPPPPRRSPAARAVIGRLAAVVAGHPADVVLAARLRLRALACVLQDLFPGGAVDDDADVILVHDDLFVAAVREPLIALPGGDIGFDPEGLRRRVVRLADAGKVG
jgi:hypothetical protein